MMSDAVGNELNYTLKRSSSARHVGFRVSMRRGLIVTVPQRFNIKKLPHYIAEKSEWINDQKQKMDLKKEAIGAIASLDLPDEVVFKSVGKRYSVEYRQTTALTVRCKAQGDVLIVYGKIKDEALCFCALGKWLQKKAKDDLTSWFEHCSETWALPYKKLGIRGQTSRWGSCSAKHSISLNKKLLFLPPDLVEYIFLHELCHTVELNHSSKFWSLVKLYDADYKDKDQQTRQSAWYEFIPAWADE